MRTVAAYLAALAHERRSAAGTLRNYGLALRRFILFLGHHTHQAIDDACLSRVTQHDIRSYFAHHREQHQLSNRSMALYLSALRSFFRWLGQTRDIRNPAALHVKAPRIAKTAPRTIAPGDIEAIIQCTEEEADMPWVQARDTALLLLLYGAGLRIAEALALKGSDGRLFQERVQSLTVLGKGRKARLVPILPIVGEAIVAYIAQCPYPIDAHGPLFYGVKGKRLHARLIQARMARARMALGLPERATPHALRHSFATHLLARGVDLRALQDLLGHASVRSTQIYTTVDAAHLLDVYRAAHPRSTD